MKKRIYEQIYIAYRSVKASCIYLLYWAVALIFPIDEKKIVFSAFEGNGYGCNPKYIAEEIIRRDKKNGTKHKLIWLVNDTSKAFPKQITVVRNNVWNRAYYLSTSKVWVDNARKPYGTRKRKGQFYIQTWHGPIGVKPEGKRRGKSFSRIARIVTKHDAKLDDCFLINSKIAEVDFSKAFYGEPLIKTGSPRCDILINDRDRQYGWVREKLGIPHDAKLLMYAPTFRGGSQNTKREIMKNVLTFDLSKVLDAFENRFGGEWYLLVRLHPQLALRKNSFEVMDTITEKAIDISLMDDMYEYLAGVDAFISDYSSAIADASIMEIPVFTYADDLKEYTKDRGRLLYDIRKLPFPVAETEDELIAEINSFDEEKYIRRLRHFFKKIELLEDGRAAARVVDLIEQHQ